MHSVYAQDYMAWETQGPIVDRSVEHLGHSERGAVLFRSLVKENIERVMAGEDPTGVVRDLSIGMIDTGLAGNPWSPYLEPTGVLTSMGVSKDQDTPFAPVTRTQRER